MCKLQSIAENKRKQKSIQLHKIKKKFEEGNRKSRESVRK